MIYFIFKYNRKKNKNRHQIEEAYGWSNMTTIPISLHSWCSISDGPDEANEQGSWRSMVITSVARMWNFSFEYENGKQSPELVVR